MNLLASYLKPWMLRGWVHGRRWHELLRKDTSSFLRCEAQAPPPPPLSSPSSPCPSVWATTGPLLQVSQQKHLVAPSWRRLRPPRRALCLFPGHHGYRPRRALATAESKERRKDRASWYGVEPSADAQPMGRTGPSHLHLPSDGMGVHVASIELGGGHVSHVAHHPYNFFFHILTGVEWEKGGALAVIMNCTILGLLTSWSFGMSKQSTWTRYFGLF